MDLYDIPPRKDPKAGSPRTPSGGIPVRAIQQYNGNGNGTIWKVSTSLLAGLFVSMVVAYFTALQGKGISRDDMEKYVKDYSARDKELLAIQQSNQDRQIGVLEGKTDRLSDLMKMFGEKHATYEAHFIELDGKFKLLGDYMEAQKTPKR